jgi:hypothetical protein
MRKPVILANGRKWRSRKDAIEHFRQMLARYSDGEKVSDATDDSDLRALLAHYDSVVPPGLATKSGTGVVCFSRQLNSGDGWATSGFHVHRSDGTTIDFSFYRAVESDPPP